MVRIVGLTGGIGSGKSLAGEYFAQLGAYVLDADDLARKVIERGTSGFDDVIATFGDAILRNGEIDRKALAAQVFADESKKKRLEAIIHPRVKVAFDEAVGALGQDEILVYEVPLIVEAKVQDRFDFIITVEAELENRLNRLHKRGLTRSESAARITSQATSEARRSIADLVIENDGSEEELFSEVERIWSDVLPKIAHRKS